LTEVDKFIETEVTAAAKNRCTHFIPLAEVPCSPVFKSYDPIPLPLDDAAPNKVRITIGCLGRAYSWSFSAATDMNNYSLLAASQELYLRYHCKPFGPRP